jgi:hypothetical protein
MNFTRKDYGQNPQLPKYYFKSLVLGIVFWGEIILVKRGLKIKGGE